MAFDSNNLSALTYANGFTLWHYKTRGLADSLTDMNRAGYFDDAGCMFREGDFILASAEGAGTVFVVSAKRAGQVSVVDLTSPSRANGRRAAA